MMNNAGMKLSHYIVHILESKLSTCLGLKKIPFFSKYSYTLQFSLITEKRRVRKNFTEEEVNYLFNGVKKMGNHWNLILWSFPFQQGRKAVDLAHKYHKLIKSSKCPAP